MTTLYSKTPLGEVYSVIKLAISTRVKLVRTPYP